MGVIKNVACAEIELNWDVDLGATNSEIRARQLRRAFATAFADDDRFHQHDQHAKRLFYRYPLVQYRWQRGKGLIVGWQEMAQRLLELPLLDLSMRLGEDAVAVSNARIQMKNQEVAVSERLLLYKLITPVLLFNAGNYRRYVAMEYQEQHWERDRLLRASILMALRGLDALFPERLYVMFYPRIRTRVCHYKNQEFLGVLGSFITNAVLPDGLGLGHGSSHGFGWSKPG